MANGGSHRTSGQNQSGIDLQSEGQDDDTGSSPAHAATPTPTVSALPIQDAAKGGCGWETGIIGRWQHVGLWVDSRDTGSKGDTTQWTYYADDTVIAERYDEGNLTDSDKGTWECTGGRLRTSELSGAWEVNISGNTLTLKDPDTIISLKLTRID